MFARRKSMYLRICGSGSPQITKRLGLQIVNPQSATFADGPLIQKIIQVRKICGFSICGSYLRTAHLWQF